MLRSVRSQLPVPLVILSLVSILLLPMLVERRLTAARTAIAENVRPCRVLVARMQLSLSSEAAGTRGFLLSGDQQYADEHGEARAERRRALADLLRKSTHVGPEFHDDVRGLADAFEAADPLLDALYSGQLTRDEYTALLPEQHVRFREVTAATADLHRALDRAEAFWAREIVGIERLRTYVTVILVLLALTAAIAVARLGRRYRLAAEREHHARAEADRRRLEVESVSATWQALIRGFSHDLKNPLNVIEGSLSLVDQGQVDTLTPRQRHAIQNARRSVGLAVEQVNDLLTVAGTTAGHIQLGQTAVDLCDVVRGVLDQYRALAEAKGLVLRAEMSDTAPPIRSDAARIGQILANLVSNAVTYTVTGGITLRVGVREDPEPERRGGWAVVEVSDTGPGLSEDEQRIVFEEFRRLKTSERTKGSGIGLAISRLLARALGGDLTVDSGIGRGTSFTLWLPLAGPANRPI
jgi:signal transduction histidine kinase